MSARYHILFDYDGVLVKQTDFAGEVSRIHGLNEKRLRSFFEKHLISCLQGKQDLVELLQRELTEIGWEKDAISLFRAIYDDEVIYNTDLIDYIRTELVFKSTCYIATNQDKRRCEWIRDNNVISGLFRKIYCSSEFGTRKPEMSYFEEIYSRLSEEQGVIPKDHLLFIDDSIENLKSAELFGLNIHHYKDFEGLRRSIDDWLSGRKFPKLQIGELELGQMKLCHSKGYSEILSERNQHQFLTESGPIDESRSILKIIRNRNLYVVKESIYWSIQGNQQEFIGFIGIHKYQSSKVYISYGIHPDYRRRGIATKVLKGVLNWDELSGKTKILATHLANTASFEMLKKLDLNYKGIQKTDQGNRHVFES